MDLHALFVLLDLAVPQTVVDMLSVHVLQARKSAWQNKAALIRHS